MFGESIKYVLESNVDDTFCIIFIISSICAILWFCAKLKLWGGSKGKTYFRELYFYTFCLVYAWFNIITKLNG